MSNIKSVHCDTCDFSTDFDMLGTYTRNCPKPQCNGKFLIDDTDEYFGDWLDSLADEREQLRDDCLEILEDKFSNYTQKNKGVNEEYLDEFYEYALSFKKLKALWEQLSCDERDDVKYLFQESLYWPTKEDYECDARYDAWKDGDREYED